MAIGGVTDWPRERRPVPMGILETMTPATSVCGHQGSPPSVSTVDSLSLPFAVDNGLSCQASKLQELDLVVAAKDSIIHDLGLQIEMMQQQRGATQEPCAIPTSETRPMGAKGRHNMPAHCRRPLEAHVTSLREEYASLRIRLKETWNNKRCIMTMLHSEIEDLAANAGTLQTEHMELHNELRMAKRVDVRVPAHLAHEMNMATLAHEEVQSCLCRETELRNAVSKVHDAQGHRLGQRILEEQRTLQDCRGAQAKLQHECNILQNELVEQQRKPQNLDAGGTAFGTTS